MAKAKRVFELAKELGVDSKAIVAKCKAESVPGIDNHMSTVKLGLAQTIREWFSEDGTTTAIETSEKVDLQQVRKPARRRAKAKSKQADDGDEASTATAVADAPAEEAPAPAKKAKAARKKATAADTAEAEPQASANEQAVGSEAPAPEAETTATPEAAVEAPAADAEAPAPASAESPADTEAAPEPVAEVPSPQPESTAPQAKPDEDQQASSEPTPVGRPNVPDRPDVVKPVGQQVAPKQVQLRGPKVVRIEKPEPVRAPRPRRAGPGGPGGVPSGDGVPGITRSRGPARGRGISTGGDEGAGGKPGKRRQLNTRRGRSADALPTGPTKFSQADMEELDARLRGATGFIKQRRRDLHKREHAGTAAVSAAVAGGKVAIEEPITIKALSAATGIRTTEILKYLFRKGVMATINAAIDTDTAMEVALEYDIELEVKQQQTALEMLENEFQQREEVDTRPRPPVVTVLGHVDHGKTSLLDRIRKQDVAAHEAGGITQHVGAYRVTITGTDEKEKTVVFLDTPGHEAFTSMRSRGAKMTDLVVLVVAADDGVMPQTIESINHAKAAEVPLIVALNKIDKAEATEDNVRRIYGQLAEHGLNPVEWGGETEIIKVSAETGQGVTDLLEILDYQAELLELKADYGGPARGTVIEAEMQPGRGSVARVLVQEGQIKVSDTIVIGRAFGRVRDMTDDRGQSIKQAGPATPLEISGIDAIPDAGDKFYVTESLQKAEQVASQFREHERQQQLASKTKVTLDNFSEQIKLGTVKELRVVLKADVQGSVDVLRESLEKVGNSEEVAVRVLHAAVGGITESDVLLADASDAIIIGFHVIATPAVREIAEARDVDIRLYRIIYDVTDDVKKALEGMLEPERKEEELGTAEVRQVFKVSKVGNVAGCLVTDGVIQRGAKMRVVRDGTVVTDNRAIDTLRRVKDDVREVRAGTECGIRIDGFDDLKAGDTLVCYNVIEVKRTLD